MFNAPISTDQKKNETLELLNSICDKSFSFLSDEEDKGNFDTLKKWLRSEWENIQNLRKEILNVSIKQFSPQLIDKQEELDKKVTYFELCLKLLKKKVSLALLNQIEEQIKRNKCDLENLLFKLAEGKTDALEIKNLKNTKLALYLKDNLKEKFDEIHVSNNQIDSDKLINFSKSLIKLLNNPLISSQLKIPKEKNKDFTIESKKSLNLNKNYEEFKKNLITKDDFAKDEEITKLAYLAGSPENDDGSESFTEENYSDEPKGKIEQFVELLFVLKNKNNLTQGFFRDNPALMLTDNDTTKTQLIEFFTNERNKGIVDQLCKLINSKVKEENCKKRKEALVNYLSLIINCQKDKSDDLKKQNKEVSEIGAKIKSINEKVIEIKTDKQIDKKYLESIVDFLDNEKGKIVAIQKSVNSQYCLLNSTPKNFLATFGNFEKTPFYGEQEIDLFKKNLTKGFCSLEENSKVYQRKVKEAESPMLYRFLNFIRDKAKKLVNFIKPNTYPLSPTATKSSFFYEKTQYKPFENEAFEKYQEIKIKEIMCNLDRCSLVLMSEEEYNKIKFDNYGEKNAILVACNGNYKLRIWDSETQAWRNGAEYIAETEKEGLEKLIKEKKWEFNNQLVDIFFKESEHLKDFTKTLKQSYTHLDNITERQKSTLISGVNRLVKKARMEQITEDEILPALINLLKEKLTEEDIAKFNLDLFYEKFIITETNQDNQIYLTSFLSALTSIKEKFELKNFLNCQQNGQLIEDLNNKLKTYINKSPEITNMQTASGFLTVLKKNNQNIEIPEVNSVQPILQKVINIADAIVNIMIEANKNNKSLKENLLALFDEEICKGFNLDLIDKMLPLFDKCDEKYKEALDNFKLAVEEIKQPVQLVLLN